MERQRREKEVSVVHLSQGTEICTSGPWKPGDGDVDTDLGVLDLHKVVRMLERV